jgi:hypothetical protein
MFAATPSSRPDAQALVFEGQHWTYAEADAMAKKAGNRFCEWQADEKSVGLPTRKLSQSTQQSSGT